MGAKDSLELETRLRQAIYWFDSHDFEQAIGSYRRIIGDFPDNDRGCEKAWTAIGEIQMLLREMDTAGASFSRALSYNPRNLQYHYWLAFIEMFFYDLQRAIAEIDYCIKQEPWRFAYQWVSGLFHWSTGRIHESITSLKQALEIRPISTRVIESLGADLTYLPDFRLALGYTRWGVLSFPGSMTARRILKALIKMYVAVQRISQITLPPSG